MKTTRTTTTLLVISVILLTGATFAYAHDGCGSGHYWGRYGGHMMEPGYGGHMMEPGYGGHMMEPGYHGHMRGYGPGWGEYRSQSGLNEKERAEVEAARDKFYNDTKELRGKIDEKAVQLRNEMIKDEPDSGTVATLQRQLSNLRAEFDQKAVAHQLKMRKLLPDKFQGRGFGRGNGR